MLSQFIIAGLTLGIISSMHCVGMCGPLSLALPTQYLASLKRMLAILLYQVGRVITYSALGFIFGLLGRRIYLAGFQQWFSIGMGMLILFLVAHHWIFRKRLQLQFLNSFYITVQRMMIRILNSKGMAPYLFFGIANGFLPCGMVYMALAGALVTTDIYQSVLFMAAFGLGTLPAMIAVSFLKQFIGTQTRSSFRKAVPILISVMAVILILRGMNLGIPFVSPSLPSATATPVTCH